jgi:hypothetical protein|tara:strand:- start:451 stop:618 length:168 start_codon:yes stop_codon:yes gene_type:complete
MIWYPESMIYEEHRIWLHEQLRIEKRTGIVFEDKSLDYFRRNIFEPALEEIYGEE